MVNCLSVCSRMSIPIIFIYKQQVIKVIPFNAASPLHTDGSIIFARLRQQMVKYTLSRALQLASIPYRCCPLLSRFEYIDCRTCPGMSWAGFFSPSKLPLHVWGSGAPCNKAMFYKAARETWPMATVNQKHMKCFTRWCSDTFRIWCDR